MESTKANPTEPGADLPERHAQLWRAMLDQLERTAALENHWLMYFAWGWLNLLACVVSHYLLVREITQAPYHWPLVAVWVAQIAAALLCAKFITGQPQIEDSPLQRYVRSLWFIFLAMACDVAILTLVAQRPVVAYLPFLATVSSFLLLVLSTLFSRRFALAALLLFGSGSLMAQFPDYAFIIYGVAWLLVLQVMALVFWRKRERWRAEVAQFRAGHETIGTFKARTVDEAH